MNILLVDDNRFVVEGIRQGVDWSCLEFEEIYCAYGSEQAKGIMAQVNIDILLCDIEMPQSTGLHLVSWIRQNYSDVVVIFLTSYAEFEYAQTAISLGAFEYLLKPVHYDRLEEVLKAAAARKKELEQARDYKRYWKNVKNKVVAMFWEDLFMERLEEKSQRRMRIEKEQLGYGRTELFLGVMISFSDVQEAMHCLGRQVFEFSFKNILQEILSDGGFGLETVVHDYKDVWIAVLKDVRDENMGDLTAGLEQFIDYARGFFECKICCYVGDAVLMDQMTEQIRKLENMEENNVLYDRPVLCLRNYKTSQVQYTLPDMKVWELYLREENFNALKKVL